MRLIIEARLVDGDSDTVEEGDGVLAVVERPDCSIAELGLSLAEGRSLLAKVQIELVSKQVRRWLAGQAHCESCGAALRHKDNRSTVLRTDMARTEGYNEREPLRHVEPGCQCCDNAECATSQQQHSMRGGAPWRGGRESRNCAVHVTDHGNCQQALKGQQPHGHPPYVRV